MVKSIYCVRKNVQCVKVGARKSFPSGEMYQRPVHIVIAYINGCMFLDLFTEGKLMSRNKIRVISRYVRTEERQRDGRNI